MSKKYAIFITALFCAYLCIFLAAGALSPDREFSSLENRTLQQLPKVSIGSLSINDGKPEFSGNFFNAAFMTEFEAYCNDQFYARDTWVGMKSAAELAIGKRENNGTYIADKGTLISHFDTPSQKRIDTNVGYLNQFISNAGVPVYLSLIPGQAAIWADRVPTGAPNADQKAVIDGIYGQVNSLTYDSYQALWNHRDEDIYYRTDHHWTSLGAYYGYASLMEALGMERVPLDAYVKTVVSEEFYGTTFSNAGVRSIGPDSIWTYVPDDGVEVTNYLTDRPQAGSLYESAALEKKDKYTYFLGGNQPLSVIKNPHVQGPKLLILRDSYADSMVPFLTKHFSEIHLYDLRYNRGSVPQYISENGIDLALVLYSVPTFVADTNFFTLGRS